jgi:solute carrier family 30 (zinc transporter), member 1
MLVLFVGIAGLTSNIVGLVLFHDHAGHGGNGHSHGGSQHLHLHDMEERQLLPVHDKKSPIPSFTTSNSGTASTYSIVNDVVLEKMVRRESISKRSRAASVRSIGSDDIFISNHQPVALQVTEIQNQTFKNPRTSSEEVHNGDITTKTSASFAKRDISKSHDQHRYVRLSDGAAQSEHHGHKNLNMKGVFLHVLGDALGNIGVIATALFIWLTDFSWRFYADPIISLVIAGIIFSSALPLVKAAAIILLQGVPRGINSLDVENDILQVFLLHEMLINNG